MMSVHAAANHAFTILYLSDVAFSNAGVNDFDRFHWVGDVIDRMPALDSRAAYAKRFLRDKLLDHKT